MSPATTKICKLCGEGFRGTTAPEELHCAKCFVKTCDVPEDTDEQFMKLVSEVHGPEVVSATDSVSTNAILPMMKDMLNHKARLSKLQNNVEQSNRPTKEKNRMKREIYRLREEKKEMESMLDRIQAKMMHLALMSSSTTPSHAPESPKSKSANETPKKTMSKKPSPETPAILKVPNNTPQSVTPSNPKPKAMKPQNIFGTTPVSQKTATPSPTATVQGTPPGSPAKQMPQQQEQATPTPAAVAPNSPNTSPVKLTALKFEAAAKKVNNVVTFAKIPSKTKPDRAPEVNNNDTPVTASSSSDEEIDDYDENLENGKAVSSALKRSNSVRDRIKAFEEIQRRASTGSYDRKKNQAGRSRRSLSSMKSINV